MMDGIVIVLSTWIYLLSWEVKKLKKRVNELESK